MKAVNYRQMSLDELEEGLNELKKRLFGLRTQAVTEKLENCKAVKNAKKDIARIKTVLKEKNQ